MRGQKQSTLGYREGAGKHYKCSPFNISSYKKISTRASIDISAVAVAKKDCLRFPYWLNCTIDSVAEVMESKREGEECFAVSSSLFHSFCVSLWAVNCVSKMKRLFG